MPFRVCDSFDRFLRISKKVFHLVSPVKPIRVPLRVRYLFRTVLVNHIRPSLERGRLHSKGLRVMLYYQRLDDFPGGETFLLSLSEGSLLLWILHRFQNFVLGAIDPS